MQFAVLGSLGFDYIMDYPGKFKDRIMADKMHTISLSFLVDTLQKQFGGTAGNIAYTSKLLGLEPEIVAYAGNDFETYAVFLKKHGISTRYITVHPKTLSGSYFVVTDQDDNQIGSFYIGAMQYAEKLSIPKGLPYAVIGPSKPAAMVKYVKQCIKDHIKYMYDPAFQIANFTSEQLHEGISHADMLIGNDYEIALVEKKLSISHRELLELVPIVITTLGAKGACIEKNGQAFTIPSAKPKNTSDPTGAGDAFRAGFLAGYFRGLDLQTCGQIGSLAAVYTVEKYGTVTHTFTVSGFCKRYKENFGKTLFLHPVQ